MGSIATKRFVSDYVRLVPLCLPKEIADSNRQFQQRASPSNTMLAHRLCLGHADDKRDAETAKG